MDEPAQAVSRLPGLDESELTLKELSTLLRISRLVTSTLDLDEILDSVLDWLRELIMYGAGGIYFYNPATNQIRLHSSRGISQDIIEKFSQNVQNNFLIQAQKDTKRGWRTTDLRSLEEVKSTPYYKDVLKGAGILYGIGAPILIDNEFAGAIHLTRPEEAHDFSTRELHLLELVANQVGVAVKNALVHKQTVNLANRYRVLTQITKEVAPTLNLNQVLQIIAENMEKLLEVDLYFLALMDPSEEVAYLKTASLSSYKATLRTVGLGLLLKDFPVLERLHESRTYQLAHFDESPPSRFFSQLGIRTLLCVPVMDRSKVIAIIMLGQTRFKRYFTDEEIDICHEAAELIGTLIVNAQAHSKTQMELNEKINALIEMEERVKRSQRLAALGEMAAMIAHEVKNPLSSINLTLFSLEKRLERGMDISEDLAALQEAAGRLSRIAGDLLNFSADTRLSCAPTQINRVLRKSLDDLRPQLGPGVEIREHYAGDLPLIEADSARLQEVFTNLLQNAAAAVEEKGTITVRTSATESCVFVAVEDDGPGIPQDILGRIFNPFFTTRARGTGLGLAIAKKIVEAHGGTIHAMNMTGKGSAFVVKLPATGSPKG